MSLYDDALVEAKKLKQIAEDDAKNAIIEDITPTIRKYIANSLAGKSNPLFEEEDPTLRPGVGEEPPLADPAGMAPAVDAGAGAMPVDAGVDLSSLPVGGSPVGAGAAEAPIKAVGADTLNMPMPGPDGKLIIDFDDLFIPSEPGEDMTGDESPGSSEAPAEIPGGLPSPEPVDVNPAPGADPVGASMAPDAATPPLTPGGSADPSIPPGPEEDPTEPQLETYELFSEALDRTAKLVHRAYSTQGIPSIMKEALQEKLFHLLENKENLFQKNVISSGLANIFEKRLEILHLKLKEALVGNTYSKTKGTDMASKSLKEMATKMLESTETLEAGSTTSPADSFKTEKPLKVDNAEEATADKAGAHAKKITEPTVTLKTEAAEVAEIAKLEEELTAIVNESEGTSLVAVDGEQDLAGAASTIPNKKVGQVDVTKTPAAGPSNPASYVQGVSEGTVSVSAQKLAEQTKKIKAEALKKQINALQEQLKECGMEPQEESAAPAAPGAGSMGMMGEEDTIINFNFNLADLVPELGQLGDDDEIEITDEEEPFGGSPMGGAEPESMELDAPSSDADPEMDLGGEEMDDKETMALAEQIRRGRGKATKKALDENKALKIALNEQELFNAKVVHLQPFMGNQNLSKDQKLKIVEYLDRGKTSAEVKAIYSRVKQAVESISKTKMKTGSSSKVSTSGSAKLQEGVENPYEGKVLIAEERNRLMDLAGIKRK